MKSCRIPQNAREFYKILHDPMGWVWDVREQQNPIKSLFILGKILWILGQAFERLNSIL